MGDRSKLVVILLVVLIFIASVPQLLNVWQQWTTPSLPKAIAVQSEGPNKAHTAFVFVHGLNGHPRDTWENENGDTWMELLGGDPEVTGSDIYTFAYPAETLTNASLIETTVGTLADHLDNDWRSYHHVVFVTHSMGGIVARDAIAQSAVEPDPAQFVTLFTFGTPFRGSRLADSLKEFTEASNTNIDLLTTLSVLRRMNLDRWNAARQRIGYRLAHYAAYEMKPWGDAGVIVPKESAIEGADDVKGFGNDHSDIVKPNDRKSASYTWLKEKMLQRIEQHPIIPRIPKGRRAVEEEREHRPSDESSEHRYVVGPGEIRVEEDIRIPIGTTLVVKPGTTLKFLGGAIVECEGRILAGERRTGEATEAAPEVAFVEFDFADTENLEGCILLRGPHTSRSRFDSCRFRSGTGLALDKPNPKPNESLGGDVIWSKDKTHRKAKQSRKGGAVVLVSASNVAFRDCEFQNNSAWIGGAVAAFNSRRIVFRRCRFETNRSGFGGGAIFTQWSEAYLFKCQFVGNSTGRAYLRPNTEEPVDAQQHACGGGMYLGARSHIEMTSCDFSENEAEYVGGALYAFDTSRSGVPGAYDVLCSDSKFLANRATADAGGGAIYIDRQTRLNLTNATFVENSSGSERTSPGQAILDASNLGGSEEGGSGLAVNGYLRLIRNGASSKDTTAKEIAWSRRSKARVFVVEPSWMENPKSFRRTNGRDRTINAIVIHHVSAINWDAPNFQSDYQDRIKEFEQETEALPAETRKYDWRFCKEIFECYGVSAHYLVDRDGVVHQLVRDKDIAFHAGLSKMPDPDNRRSANLFSIGIELVSAHPEDDKSVNAQNAYTDEQYSSLDVLLSKLCKRYKIPIRSIVGHDEIAPGRKKDPGPLFDWDGVKNRLSRTLNRE